MATFILLALTAADPVCPNMEGVWMQGRGERVMVVEQEGCRLSGTVAEPDNQILHVRGFWTGSQWTMSATRQGVCATSAWGAIRSDGRNALVIQVLGSDGLCGPNGAAGAGPTQFNATMTYRRFVPEPASR